jgi:hypothetical protein
MVSGVRCQVSGVRIQREYWKTPEHEDEDDDEDE